MADTLELFGNEYENVTGIIVTDDNGDELLYTREVKSVSESDFSTALVNINIITSDPSLIASITLSTYIIYNINENYSVTYNTSGCPAINNTCEILLCKGIGYITDITYSDNNGWSYHINKSDVTVTGDIVWDNIHGCFVVTGNGTMTGFAETYND